MDYIVLQNNFLRNKSHTNGCTSKVADKHLVISNIMNYEIVYINHD